MSKKLLLLTAAIFSFSLSFSQSHFYTTFGYNLGYAKLEGLNYTIDRYNETREWLSDPMENFHFPNGFCASLGGSSNRLMFDFTWVGRHMTRTAGGTQPNGVEGRREVKWRMNTFNTGLGVTMGKGRNARVNLGVSFDIGYERVFTRLAQDGVWDSEEFQEAQKELLLGSSVFLQIILAPSNIPGGIFIRPYVQFPYFKTDYYWTNATINSATYNNDPLTIDSNSMNFGVQLQIGLFAREGD